MATPDLQPPVFPKNICRFFAQLLSPHLPWFLVALFFNCLSGVAISAQTLAPKYLIDDILLVPGLDGQGKAVRVAVLCVLYLLATIVCRMLFWHIGYRIFTRIREAVLRELRSVFFRHVNWLCLRFHSKRQSGELFSYLFGTPLNQVQQFFQMFSVLGPHSVFMIIGTIVWVACWDWMLTLVLLLSLSATVWTTLRVRPRVKALHQEYQNQESAVSGRVADLLRGSRHVKLYAIEDQVESRFENDIALIGQKGIWRDIKNHELWMRQEAVGYLGFIALASLGAWRFIEGHVQIGELSAYLTAFASLQWPINNLLQVVNLQGGAQASLERILDVLNTCSTTPEPDSGKKAKLPGRNLDIRFENVAFGYEGTPVFRNLNLEISYGQKVALVGPSGSGKSTLTQLLLRLYDPDEGRVTLGGIDLRTCSGREVRRCFGVVPQDPYFFSATVRENIRLLKPDAAPEELRSALEKARAWEFVEQLPQGLETRVGEQGCTLSGGQRQRLAIARALLPDPPCFVFDEATSALDALSERHIQEAMEQAVSGRTCIVIAHRLATVKNCDRLLVLKEGRIVQDGTYQDLSRQPGLFRDLLRQHEFHGAEG